MAFKLPDLPYPADALEPHISRRTLEFHHGKHHAAYVSKTNELISGTPYADMGLEDIIRKSHAKSDERTLFNNSAQVWNHTFFWNCMRKGGGGQPQGDVAKRLQESFGGYDGFRKKFTDAAVGQFGSGWAWLALDGGKATVYSTKDAENPLIKNQVPLLTCDVWEHAYYLDYQNQRKSFVDAFLDHLVNWTHVENCLRDASAQKATAGAHG